MQVISLRKLFSLPTLNLSEFLLRTGYLPTFCCFAFLLSYSCCVRSDTCFVACFYFVHIDYTAVCYQTKPSLFYQSSNLWSRHGQWVYYTRKDLISVDERAPGLNNRISNVFVWTICMQNSLDFGGMRRNILFCQAIPGLWQNHFVVPVIVTAVRRLDGLAVWCSSGLWETGVRFPIQVANNHLFDPLLHLVANYRIHWPLSYNLSKVSSVVSPGIWGTGVWFPIETQNFPVCWNPLLHLVTSVISWTRNAWGHAFSLGGKYDSGQVSGLVVWCLPGLQETGVRFPIEAQSFSYHRSSLIKPTVTFFFWFCTVDKILEISQKQQVGIWCPIMKIPRVYLSENVTVTSIVSEGIIFLILKVFLDYKLCLQCNAFANIVAKLFRRWKSTYDSIALAKLLIRKSETLGWKDARLEPFILTQQVVNLKGCLYIFDYIQRFMGAN